MSYIYRDTNKNIHIDASNGLATGNTIYFKTRGLTRAFIDDISGNLDVSFNQLTSVSNIRAAPMSRTAPGDASYNFL